MQVLAGLSEVSLASSRKSTRKAEGRAILKASPCQWIDLEKVREDGNGCVNGSKFVVSKERGVSKQFDHQCKEVQKVKSLNCSNLGFETWCCEGEAPISICGRPYGACFRDKRWQVCSVCKLYGHHRRCQVQGNLLGKKGWKLMPRWWKGWRMWSWPPSVPPLWRQQRKVGSVFAFRVTVHKSSRR